MLHDTSKHAQQRESKYPLPHAAALTLHGLFSHRTQTSPHISAIL